jgi:hypothetical protein
MAHARKMAVLTATILGFGLVLVTPATLHAQTQMRTDGGPPDILSTPGSQPTTQAPPATNSRPAAAAPPAGQLSPNAQQRPAGTLPPAVSASPSVDGTPTRTRIAIAEEMPLPAPAASGAGQPQQVVRGRFADIVQVTDPKLRDQVVVTGVLRTEPGANDQTKGTISWTGVARIDQADKKKPLSSPLQSQLNAPKSEKSVPAGQSLTAQGDVAAALAAARALFEDEKKDKQEGTTNTQQAQQQPRQQSGSGGLGNEPKNDMMRAIQVPDGNGIVVNPETADVTATTTEGCTVRIDLAQGVAIQQSRITTNGTPTGECGDTEVRFQLQKSYIGCEDLVKKEESKAFAQFRNYYMRTDGTTSYLGDTCQQDSETAFALVEEPGGCTTETNIPELKAYKRSELIYINKQAQRIVVEGCRRTPDADPIAMTKSLEGCAIRHDFAGGNSVQQQKIVYIDGQGAMFQVSGCADSEEAADRFVHTKDFDACTPIVNMSTMQAIPQYRIFILPPNGKSFITECTPDQDAAVAVQESLLGCEQVFFHDLPASQSFGASRFRYQGLDGTWKWVNETCQKSTVTFAHQLETQGYENHDDQRFSYMKQAVFINTSGGRVDVSPALVRAGSAQIPYTLTGTANVPRTADVTYQGCNKYVPTDATESYKRADNTNYSYVTGAGPVNGPTDACVNTLIDSRWVNSGYYYNHTPPNPPEWSWWTRTATVAEVKKHERKNAETGEVVGNTCSFGPGGWFATSGSPLESTQYNLHWSSLPSPGGPVQQLFMPTCPY